jgi:hypothetical protein
MSPEPEQYAYAITVGAEDFARQLHRLRSITRTLGLRKMAADNQAPVLGSRPRWTFLAMGPTQARFAMRAQDVPDPEEALPSWAIEVRVTCWFDVIPTSSDVSVDEHPNQV